ncbi:beta-lactamase family protein [Clostridium sp. 'deep sea']|uniref:serine hydrolase domain-containing protein n=1 Tax=Clostridium sp. 'deep sea' TaxID=2779445 RepID=UPI00189687F4|nr:serine hydrolase domain-containing protein [Clostridium sp. 'deep sea']QOR35300.1 beta-lactamase family protein [Clostridium sp. 'deep sea']
MINLSSKIKEDYPHIKSILVYKENKNIYEQYFNNTDIHTLHNTACIFKSFLTTLIGICLDKGYLKSLDIKLIDIFKEEVTADVSERMKDITIAHVLSKTTGIKWPPPINNISDEQANNIEFVFTLPTESKAGEKFAYKPDPYIIPFIIEKVSAMRFNDFLDKYLFELLSIYNYEWHRGFNARATLKLTTRDIAKLGLLYLNKGVYSNTAVVSNNFLVDATTTKTAGGMPEFKDYGYLWWITKINSSKAYYASGFGGQYMCVIPNQNLVITITSKLDRPHPENLKLIELIAADL